MSDIIEELREPTGPLKNRLGSNGPYIGGLRDPIDRDCDRVPDHSDLFRNLEHFEADLIVAAERVQAGLYEIVTSELKPRESLSLALALLVKARLLLRDAHLMAQVLGEREARRLTAIGQGNVSDLVINSRGPDELRRLKLKLELRQRDTRHMLATLNQRLRQLAQ